MSEGSEIEHLRKAVTRLTLAVWFVAASVFVLVGFYLTTMLFPLFYYPEFSGTSISDGSTDIERELGQGKPADYWNNFHELPVEKKIEEASVIAISRYKEGDGDRLIAIVSEVLKKTPGIDFYYEVGQEYAGASRHKKENTSYGDGVLAFFTGSPATFRYSTSFQHDRIGGLGDLPLERFREMLKPVVNEPET